MKTGIIAITGLMVLSGCSGNPSSGGGGVLRSIDGGKTFEQKVAFTDKESIAGADIVSLVIDPKDVYTVYAGTLKSGIFVTHDGAEQWQQVAFPPQKVYGLVVDPANNATLYATGVWQEVARVYKSTSRGEKWDQIYTEPKSGTVLTALQLQKGNTERVFAGTSEGILISSPNGGATWENIYDAKEAITAIAFDAMDPNTMYVQLFRGDILRTRDGGKTFSNVTEKTGEFTTITSYSIATDPTASGIVLVGTDDGVVRSTNFGDTWETVDIIGSSRNIPVRAIAIHPGRSDQFTYAAGNAVYTSVAGTALQWSIAESSPAYTVDEILYNQQNPDNIYLGLRKL